MTHFERHPMLPPRGLVASRLFVYGSLRTGGSHRSLLEDAQRIGEIRTAPYCALVTDGNFPGLIPGDQSVLGEIFEVTPSLWKVLDAFEGCPEIYTCSAVMLENGERAWAYWIRPAWAERMTPVAGGDWLRARSDASPDKKENEIG